ncbi:hypothetical protein ABT391_15725 [Streptomyces jumonjinensis]|uniref:Secreted protein n=1 Tax=Streptomyces jumonjinensis TaxID=1945 RepID=A0A646KBS2_STRJU|nr:hypothetical protein [Streptomyces jumonjinensis]
MQPSELPDLAHTRTRPAHWLATAAALAAAIALAGGLQSATASQPGKTAARPGDHTAPADPRPKTAPDPARVALPLECGAIGSVISQKTTGDLDGDRTPETVVAAHCDAGSGTPPSGIYVLAHDRKGTPRVVATLIDTSRQQTADKLAIHDGTVTATLLGYSSAQTPRCCPDLKETAEWQWKDGKFLRTAGSEPRAL